MAQPSFEGVRSGSGACVGIGRTGMRVGRNGGEKAFVEARAVAARAVAARGGEDGDARGGQRRGRRRRQLRGR